MFCLQEDLLFFFSSLYKAKKKKKKKFLLTYFLYLSVGKSQGQKRYVFMSSIPHSCTLVSRMRYLLNPSREFRQIWHNFSFWLKNDLIWICGQMLVTSQNTFLARTQDFIGNCDQISHKLGDGIQHTQKLWIDMNENCNLTGWQRNTVARWCF